MVVLATQHAESRKHTRLSLTNSYGKNTKKKKLPTNFWDQNFLSSLNENFLILYGHESRDRYIHQKNWKHTRENKLNPLALHLKFHVLSLAQRTCMQTRQLLMCVLSCGPAAGLRVLGRRHGSSPDHAADNTQGVLVLSIAMSWTGALSKLEWAAFGSHVSKQSESNKLNSEQACVEWECTGKDGPGLPWQFGASTEIGSWSRKYYCRCWWWDGRQCSIALGACRDLK